MWSCMRQIGFFFMFGWDFGCAGVWCVWLWCWVVWVVFVGLVRIGVRKPSGGGEAWDTHCETSEGV